MLTAKQIRFVDEYMIDSNAKQAAIRAGYSPRSAEFQGSKLLADSKVSQEINKRKQELAEKNAITVQTLVDDLIYIKDKNKDNFAPAAISAIKEIGKLLNLYPAEKHDHTTNGKDIASIQVTIVEKKDDTEQKTD